MSAVNDSPCVRQCCLNRDDVCMGCFRTLDNILKWTTYSAAMRQQVLAECATRKANQPRVFLNHTGTDFDLK